ncbi:pseudoprotein wtf element Wtf1 [Asimina triloba]
MDFASLYSSSTTTASLPLFLSHPSSSFSAKSSIFSPIANLSFPLKTPFLGNLLRPHKQGKKSRLPPFPLITTAAVKWRKERPLDNVIERDKKLKLVLRIRKILVSQPDRIMTLRELGKYRRKLSLTRKRRFIAILKRFPAVFEIVEEGVYSLRFKLTAEAERLYLEEMRVRNEMEGNLVEKLRKLLMMSAEKRILLEKIAHLRTDLGLPLEFRDTICHRYPQYFKVVSTGRGPALELTHWDPQLAVSAAEQSEEENRAKELEEKNLIIERPPKFHRAKLPKGLNLSKGELRRLSAFRALPFISPYSDFSELRSGSLDKEKHACAVVHEILSFTIEKRTLVDHLTHFREEFRFSQQLRGMLIRHPDMFYVSLKGDRDSVFLREAYRNSQLVDKDRLLLIKEKMRALVAVPRFGGRGGGGGAAAPKIDGDAGSSEEVSGLEEEGDDELSDVDISFSDGRGSGDEFDDEFNQNDDDDDGEDYEDDWSDDDDEVPPDFDEEQAVGSRRRKPIERRGNEKSKSEEESLPVFPDGRPRERW